MTSAGSLITKVDRKIHSELNVSKMSLRCGYTNSFISFRKAEPTHAMTYDAPISLDNTLREDILSTYPSLYYFAL